MGLIAIVNLEERSAYALSMHQSVDQSALQVAEEELCLISEELKQLSRHVVADGYYARAGFISALIVEGFEIVTLLRRDAALRYLYRLLKSCELCCLGSEYQGRDQGRSPG